MFYQIPVNARKLPLVFWHGMGQFSKTWETTPDGREGYQNIFLRRGFGVYVIDQPRRGNAGRSTQPSALTPVPDEQRWFNFFRVGIWPNYFPGVQFSRDSEALNQYFRQMTPDTGPIDLDVDSDAVTALFKRIGPGILVTNSHSCGMGWRTAIKSRNVRAIVAYEPGSNFVFPNDEAPPPMPSSGGRWKRLASVARWKRLACLCRSSCCSQKSRSSSSMATTFQRNRRRTLPRTSGAYVWRWQGYGGML